MGIENEGFGTTGGDLGGQTGAQGSAMDELLQVTRDLRDNLSRLLGASKNLATEKLSTARSNATDLLGRGRERVSGAYEGGQNYVREEPMKALLVAAGAGLLLGYLIKRR